MFETTAAGTKWAVEAIPDALFLQEQSKNGNHAPLSKANVLLVLLQNSRTSSHRLGHGPTTN